MKKIFDIMLIIGLVMLAGRIVTAILTKMDIAFTTFFSATQIPSMVLLIVGLIGSEIYKRKKV